jgi:hypothetical protein
MTDEEQGRHDERNCFPETMHGKPRLERWQPAPGGTGNLHGDL